AKQVAWEKSASFTPWTVLDLATATAEKGTVLAKQSDGSLLASGKNPYPETYTVTANAPMTGITAFRLEVLADPHLPSMGPGRSPNGNFVLNEFTVTAAAPGQAAKP